MVELLVRFENSIAGPVFYLSIYRNLNFSLYPDWSGAQPNGSLHRHSTSTTLPSIISPPARTPIAVTVPTRAPSRGNGRPGKITLKLAGNVSRGSRQRTDVEENLSAGGKMFRGRRYRESRGEFGPGFSH
ncbi:hypothetical protein H6P81_014784 [Aristolochia fimbriata]|uniref:Uncharacterized protein n=1 Tax=Aristolochia fimbriata TaxID=158543 RepID=A0AAV7E4J1_ARIFI|nr:hypothetical protein H6P81_014784 [Aristolochia fimbriata]